MKTDGISRDYRIGFVNVMHAAHRTLERGHQYRCECHGLDPDGVTVIKSVPFDIFVNRSHHFSRPDTTTRTNIMTLMQPLGLLGFPEWKALLHKLQIQRSEILCRRVFHYLAFLNRCYVLDKTKNRQEEMHPSLLTSEQVDGGSVERWIGLFEIVGYQVEEHSQFAEHFIQGMQEWRVILQR